MEQAIWCQAAMNTLAQCILLPPLANTEEDERFRHELLPHVDHVRECQQEIQETIIRNKKRSRRPDWLFPKTSKSRNQIIQLARFSRVYAQCGRWNEAEKLQLEVKNFVAPLGPEHPSTIRIKLALSGTYWQNCKGNEAAELQSQALQAHVNLFGEEHPDTLKVMDLLGESRWRQGQFTNSLKLHEQAYNGFMRILGPGHANTLKAADNLGRAHATLWRMERARELLVLAVAGMRSHSELGPMHLDTLVAMDHLALAYLERQPFEYNSGEDLDRAYDLSAEVLASREKKLGKEHPDRISSLHQLSICYKMQGKFDEAVKACEEAIQGLAAIGGQAHPYMVHLEGVSEELQSLRTASRAAPVSQLTAENISENSAAG